VPCTPAVRTLSLAHSSRWTRRGTEFAFCQFRYSIPFRFGDVVSIASLPRRAECYLSQDSMNAGMLVTGMGVTHPGMLMFLDWVSSLFHAT
jgi:hypothetical protein